MTWLSPWAVLVRDHRLFGTRRALQITVGLDELRSDEYDIRDDQTLPGLQTATHQATAYRDHPLHLRQTCLAGLTPRVCTTVFKPPKQKYQSFTTAQAIVFRLRTNCVTVVYAQTLDFSDSARPRTF